MKRIGMVVAIKREIAAVLEKFGQPLSEKRFGTMSVSDYRGQGYDLFVAHSGAGEIAAAAATELLIDLYQAEMILNVGVVGGLTPEMASARSVIVTKVVHYDYDASPIDPVVPGQYLELPDVYIPTDARLAARALTICPDLKPVICASADRFIDKSERKAALHEAYGAEVCDMESAAISLTAHRHGIPALLLKTVADSITGGAEGFEKSCRETALVAMEIAVKLIGELK